MAATGDGRLLLRGSQDDDGLRQGSMLREHNLARLFVALEPPGKTVVIGYYTNLPKH